jgi:NADPH:quinone reductase-like Zn-dependent oxidoreductase
VYQTGPARHDPQLDEQILAWQAQGKITPVVDRSFAFAEAAAAYRHIEGRGNVSRPSDGIVGALTPPTAQNRAS